MARASLFNETLALRIMELAMAGKTDEEISSTIGISLRTFNNWKTKHTGLVEALKDAKYVADELVEASLFSRAVGYSHPDVQFFWDAKRGEINSKAFIKRHPPDVTACIFWLKNRQPKTWRDGHREQEDPTTGLDKPVKSPWAWRKPE